MRRSPLAALAGTRLHRLLLLLGAGAMALALVAVLLALAAGQAQAAQPGHRVVGSARSQQHPQPILEWTLLAPSNWTRSPVTCTVIVTCSDGLDPATALYQVSTDGGTTWTPGPTPAASYRVFPLSVYITATNVLFPHSSADQNRILFGVTDLLGNQQVVPNDTPGGFIIRIDNDAPGAPTSFVYNHAWSNVNGVFTITWTNPSDLSGIARAYYKLDSPPTSNGDYSGPPASGDDVHALSNVSVTGAGRHSIYVWLQDVAGNRRYQNYGSAVNAFSYDPQAPLITATLQPPVPLSGWYRVPVTATLTASDPGGANASGVASQSYRLDSGAWYTAAQTLLTVPINAPDGVHTLYYRAKDVAGNSTTTRSQPIQKDQTPPVITGLAFSRPPDSGGWYRSPVTVTVQAQDPTPGSGLAQVYHQVDGTGEFQPGATFPVSAEGVHTIRAWASDLAGNVSPTWIFTDAVKIDRTAPVVTLTRSAPPNAYGWYSNTVCITITAAEVMTSPAPSGVEAVEYRALSGNWQAAPTPLCLSGEGMGSYEARARDVAGNITASRPFTMYIDRTPPGFPGYPIQVIPATWTNSNVFTVTWTYPTSPVELSGFGWVRYTIDVVPGPGVPPAGTLPVQSGPTAGTGMATGIRVPSEGAHTLYFWLVDKAGNANPYNYRAVQYLRYDATPPTNARAVLSGTLGCNNYYISPVRVSLRADEPPTASGVGAFTWTTGTTWITTTTSGPENEAVITLSGDNKYTLRYKAIDRAGNTQPAVQTISFNTDTTPPGPPSDLQVAPLGWSHTPTYTVSWRTPPPPYDFTGIDGGLYTVNQVPTAPGDGTFTRASYNTRTGRYEAMVVVPQGQEGQLTLYFRLRDGACGSNPGSAVPIALRYDGTPPTTTVTRDRPPDHDPWYTRPVTLTFTANDGAGSGVDQTYYQFGNGPAQAGNRLVLSQSGVYTVCYASTDVAGNREVTRTTSVRVDMTPPVGWVNSPASSEPGFTVRWGANDAPANQVSCYWVQYREDTGPWQAWQTETAATSAVFPSAQRGHRYGFRVRARDEAGNEGTWPANAQAVTWVTTLVNGNFTSGLDGWQVVKDDPTWQVSVVPGVCGATKAALLGSPDYLDCPGGPGPGCIPMGAARLLQAVDLPVLGPGEHVYLGFRYKIITWDTAYGENDVKFDTFEVDVLNASGQQLGDYLLIDGYIQAPGEQWVPMRRDLGCRVGGPFDLTAYAGQRVKLQFANWNRYDHTLNTYTYLEEVRLFIGKSISLPLVQRGGSPGAASQQTSLAPSPAEPELGPIYVPRPNEEGDPRQR